MTIDRFQVNVRAAHGQKNNMQQLGSECPCLLGKGTEYDHSERMRIHFEALRMALRAGQERSRNFADITRLLEKKIEAMKDEARLHNRKE